MGIFKRWFGKKPNEAAPDDEAGLFEPRMPEVDEPPFIEEVFERARQSARDGSVEAGAPEGQRHIVVVTPGRLLLLQRAPAPGTMSAEKTAPAESFMPREPARNIAVISYTELLAVRSDIWKAIPFAGILTALAYIGHAVWIFEGHPSALAAGCRDADILIVDDGMIPFLQEDWADVAAGAMRREEIFVHMRSTFSLGRVVRTR